MPGLNDLYQEILLEHNSKPHNFRKMEEATQSAEGFNPLCGDMITVFLTVADDVITDVSFQGSGCAISRASASMMTERIKGKTSDEARKIFDEFHQMITRGPNEDFESDSLGDLDRHMTVPDGVDRSQQEGVERRPPGAQFMAKPVAAGHKSFPGKQVVGDLIVVGSVLQRHLNAGTDVE